MKNKNEQKESRKKLRNELIIHSIIMLILFIICVWDRKVNNINQEKEKIFIFMKFYQIIFNLKY